MFLPEAVPVAKGATATREKLLASDLDQRLGGGADP